VTPRDRWLATLAGERPDRAPCDYWGTAGVTCRLLSELGCANERDLWERLGIDRCIHLAPLHPDAREGGWHIQSLFSIWHVETKPVVYGGEIGEYAEDAFHPLAALETIADIDQSDWPDPADFDTGATH
jgi:hypothetical protein